MAFFSEVKSFFKEEFSGRYFEIILKNIAIEVPSVLKPLIGNQYKKNIRIETEHHYKSGRKADIAIFAGEGVDVVEFLIEVKIKDSIMEAKNKTNDQLQDYLEWAMDPEAKNKRKFILLTAYSIDKEYQERIKQAEVKAEHIYISKFHEDLKLNKESSRESNAIDLLLHYLIEEGYAMYKLNDNNDDIEALKSFLVLNFLIHESGHGRVKSKLNISLGPLVFSKLINNFQLISSRVSSDNNLKPKATVGYLPEQIYKEKSNDRDQDFIEFNMLHRLKNRSNRGNIGRYWLSADAILHQNPKIRLEWGQIIQIEKDVPNIKCILYAGIREGSRSGRVISQYSHELKNGIEDDVLFSPEKFTHALQELIEKAKKQFSKDSECCDLSEQIFSQIQA